MEVANGSTDVTTYFVLRDSTNHAPKTDVTVTDIDLYYVEQGAAISAKADVTALSAADDAHTDNYGFHVGNGLYRIDWPDTCFNGGVGKYCYLIVVCTGVDTTFLEVRLKDPEQTGDSYAVVAHADYGNAKLVRSTTPANTLTVDASNRAASDALAINSSTTAAARLALSADSIIPGTVDTASFTPTSTIFEADDITEATADHYKYRLVIFTSGALLGQCRDISAYSKVGSNGRFTVTALTEAPANNDTFIIV